MSGLSKVNLFQCGLENIIFLTPEKVSEPLTLAIEIISIFLLVYNLLGDCRVRAHFLLGVSYRFSGSVWRRLVLIKQQLKDKMKMKRKQKTHMYGR